MKTVQLCCVAAMAAADRHRRRPIRQGGGGHQIPPGALFVIGQRFRTSGRHGAGQDPVDARWQDNADVVLNMSKLPWAGFGRRQPGRAKGAKPAIWKEQAKFKEHAGKLEAEGRETAAAARPATWD